jgi:hypothetical protein
MERYYEEQYQYNQAQYYNNNNNGEGEGEQHSADQEEYEQYLALASIQSGSLTFVAMYTLALALALSMYGSTAIVGFTSLRGVYIAPCFSSSSASSSLKLGMFGGTVIFFANMLLVCAVIFGEVRVCHQYRCAQWWCRFATDHSVFADLVVLFLMYCRSKTGDNKINEMGKTKGNRTKWNE